jgi:hypothetical protein
MRIQRDVDVIKSSASYALRGGERAAGNAQQDNLQIANHPTGKYVLAERVSGAPANPVRSKQGENTHRNCVDHNIELNIQTACRFCHFTH